MGLSATDLSKFLGARRQNLSRPDQDQGRPGSRNNTMSKAPNQGGRVGMRVTAGGPGSGRHPGGGANTISRHEVLRKNGWKLDDAKSNTYSHGSHPGHVVQIERNGLGWQHFSKNTNNQPTRGSGAAELGRHLSKFHDLVAKDREKFKGK